VKFAVIGSGAIGSYYSGVLKRAGNEVYLLSRGRSLENIKRDGLKVISDDSEFVVRPDVVSESIEDFGSVDVVIVAVKAWQVNEIASKVGKLLKQGTMILPLQNGVEAYPTLKELYPESAVGGLTRIICYVETPGTVRQVGFQPNITFGRDDSSVTPTMSAAKEAFLKAGIACDISQDIQRDIWKKFLIMATLGGVGSVTQAPVGVMRSLKETRDMMDASMDEVIRVARSLKINIGPEEKEQAWKWYEALHFGATSSTQRDIASGKPSEIDDLSGALVRLGRINNVDVPLHRFIYSSILPREEKARARLNY
jgi:2-dehydropantoate 2-reductase